MKKDTRTSFTSADAFPVKLLQDTHVVRSITQYKAIPPVHVQLIPTNRCNLSCSFCSCSNEDRTLEMNPREAERLISNLAMYGTKALTITGGGEPLLYPGLGGLLNVARICNLRVGLVTNGLLLGGVEASTLRNLTWCRISHGDDREELTKGRQDMIREAVKAAPNVDWAFSYVVSPKINKDRINQIIQLANELNFTHIRFVADLLQPENVDMTWLHGYQTKTAIIIQERDFPERGKDCRICYLKPVIGPDMKVYACCGVQYAMQKPSLSLPPELCLGTVEEFLHREDRATPFAGAKHCFRCYYGAYNRTLAMLLSDTIHKEFV